MAPVKYSASSITNKAIRCNPRKNLRPEAFVGKAFRRDQEDIDFVVYYRLLNVLPVIGIVRVNSVGPNAHAPSREELIAH